MITRQSFAEINKEVREAIQTALENLKKNDLSNYLLFLADGEYIEDYEVGFPGSNPYVIDNQIDKYRDETRLKFLTDFLTTFYSFPSTEQSTDDNQQRVHLELMVYSHIWESTPFLKKLYRLAHISNKEDYNWKVSVPDMGKHGFICDDIRATFNKSGSQIGLIIKKGFHSSLRNAFAHSDYSFDTTNNNNRIWLHNFKGKNWELQDISFDDWSIRFVCSALLSYYILSLTQKHRANLISDFGTDKFTIRHPSTTGLIRNTKIVYRQEHDAFNFED